MSGWKLVCPRCAAPALLPDALAREGARVRCPECGAIFAAADPAKVEACTAALETWLRGEPGGRGALLAAREAGKFWEDHGASLFAFCDGDGAAFDPAVVRAALARALGPGRELF